MTNERVRLDRFRLLAYRSCRDTQLSINEGVTALIGPNGAGKTNLLHGLLLLSLANRRFSSKMDDSYTRECKVEADFLVGKKRVLFQAAITYRPTEQNRDEVVAVKERWNFKSITGKSKWVTSEELILGQTGRGIRVQRLLSRQVIYFSHLHHSSLANPKLMKARFGLPSNKSTDAYNAVQKFRFGISYYSASQFTNPALCPTSIEIDEEGDLSEDLLYQRQTTHVRFVYDLYRLSKKNKNAYKRYVSLIDAEGVGLIRKLNWREVKLSSQAYEVRAGGRVISKRGTRTMIIPTVHVGTSQLSLNQLSEGTLRTMAMLFYVVTDKSELLLLEEPEVCVHHGLLSSVIQVIKEYGRTKQIIFSTHAEAVVDGLKPEQVLLVDKRKNKGTTVSSISKRMSQSGYAALKNYLSTAGNLGEFWRHSGFG
jgi:ABC-type multidrug transport system ATPase subunit